MGRRSAGVVTSGLMVLFILVGSLGVLRGLDVECGCFTVSASGMRLGWAVLLRDMGLLAASVYAAVHPSDAWSVAGLLRSRADRLG
ncbi:MAG: hypothetical protein JSV65_08840 [Armatimonadota bacterium]|nr:MAG: hypothetical protein JSV65_08840 [Armatimonadota bacterium]